ncbi:PH domain-containing protein [Gordonia sp. zg691]|uniref:PH domain-containing protein n=1 Tax=Gordonia jinghuaiqii TaxID=2758710 RepID=UPI001662413E|nr:PH domain-containing protein [Gordonia jinghuaiqii]MBD0862874.1 PH domain-containing protein [Gordonia jinghuaiqii]
MDNSAELYTQAWATPRAAGIAGCVGGVILLAAAVVVSADPAGSVLMGVAGVLLAALGAYTLFVRPRLAISDGVPPTLMIRTLGGRRTYTPDRVERIRMLSLRRVGRRVGQLEIDVLADDAPSIPPAPGGAPREDTRLVVFSRWDLGADLFSVVDALRAAGFVVDDE